MQRRKERLIRQFKFRRTNTHQKLINETMDKDKVCNLQVACCTCENADKKAYWNVRNGLDSLCNGNLLLIFKYSIFEIRFSVSSVRWSKNEQQSSKEMKPVPDSV